MSLPIFADEPYRWDGEQPGDHFHLGRWLKRKWPPRAWWCCCTATSLCVNCATSRWTDDFSTGLAGSYTTATCAGGLGNTFASGSGFLTESFGGAPYTGSAGVCTQGITVPTLSGLCISVCAQIYGISGKNAGATGVTIGGGPEFHARYLAGVKSNFVLQPTTLATGCVTGGGASTFGSTWVDGDTITLHLADSSGGAGTYDVTCYINGTLSKTLAGQAYTFTAGSTIQCGVYDTNGGQWANLKIYTS